MAVSKKTDLEALKKLREKVKNNNINTNAPTSKVTNKSTSRTTTGSALQPSKKTDTEALNRLREKVKNKNNSYSSVSTPTKTTLFDTPITSKDYSSAVKSLQDKGVSGASGIMTESEWRRRKGKEGGTYQDYIDNQVGKYGKGNIDLTKRPRYKNPDNTISTVDSFSINENGKEILLPTIVWGENGTAKRLSENEAIDHYHKTGEHLGKFDTPDEANRYAERLHEVQALLYPDDESNPRSANFWDVTVNSIRRGYNNSIYGQESFKAMHGMNNKKEEYEKKLQDYDYNFTPDNKFEEWTSGTMELIGQIARQWTDPTSIALGTSAAGAAAIAGQVGPQVALPEEAITVPGAFIAGLSAGGVKANLEIEAGHAYNEMVENGISPDVAKGIATVVGVGNAALEMFQLDDLMKSAKILQKTNADNTVTKKLIEYLVSRGVHVATETAQEVGQEGVTLAGVDIARMLEGKDAIYSWGDVGQRLGDTAVSSAMSFAMLGAGGDVANYGINKTGNAIARDKKQTENAENIAKDDKQLDFYVTVAETSGEGTKAYEIAQEVKASKGKGEVTADQVKRLINETSKQLKISAKNTKIATDYVRKQAAKEMVVDVAKRSGKVNADMLDRLTTDNQQIYVDEVKKVTGFGDKGARMVTGLANRKGVTFSQAKRMVETAYQAGYSNVKEAQVGFDNGLQKEAFRAGKYDRAMDDGIAQTKAKEAQVFDGAFTENEHTKNFTVGEKKMIATVAKALRMDVETVDEILANITYDKDGNEKKHYANAQHFDGKLTIASNRDVTKAIYSLVMHESGHRMSQLAPTEFGALMDALYQRAERRAAQVNPKNTEFGFVKAEHDIAGIDNMNTRAYVEEIAVRELETIFSSAEEFNKWYDEINGNAELKGNWQKFCEWIKKVIADIKTALAQRKMSAEEKAAAKEELAELEHIKGLLENAFKGAEKAATELSRSKSENSLDNNLDNNLDNKADAEGNANFSLKNKNLTISSRIPFVEHKNYIAVAKNDYSALGTLETKVKNIKRGTYQNDATGYSADINGDTIRKALNPTHNKFDAFNTNHIRNLNAMLKLPELFKNAVYVDTKNPQKSKNQNPSYKGYHHFVAPLFMDNAEYRALITAREKVNSNTLYVLNVEVLSTQKRHTPSAAQQNIAVGSQLLSVPSDISIPELVNGVKIYNYDTKITDTYTGADIKFSLKDSLGNTLTEAQAEYFKDSQVRDNKGRLIPVYHGTTAIFNVFKKGDVGYHFGTKGAARGRVGYGKNAIIKEVYLNITNPIIFDEDLGSWDADFRLTKELYERGILNREEAERVLFTDDKQYKRSTERANKLLVEVLTTKGYDGIKYSNTFETKTPTVSYIAFKSEQAKLTSNENPTSNPDIRFSLKKSVEETKDLIAVHNVRENKLLEALKLGGLPSPSIAITKKDMSHDKFGDISLVFRKETISPTDRRNKIYSGDAYTPTGVRVEYDVDDDVVQEFNKRLKELTPEWANERLPSVDSGTADVENDSLYNAYERNDRAKLAFLREKGKAPKVAMRTPRLSTFVSNDTIVALAKSFSAKQLNDIANTSEGVKQYKNAFLKVIRDVEDSRFVETGIYSADEASLYDIAETARKAASVKENKYKIKKEVDTRKTYELIDKKFTKALKAEYRAWIDENTKAAIVDKGIRNNRDLFTPSGNRRSFKQLHEPYNLGNIVKQMFSGEDKGIALFGGSPIGAAQHEYSSIADVKADSSRLQALEQEEYDKIRGQIEDDVFELARKMQTNSDVFAIRDLLTEAIGKKTKQQADVYLRRESQGWAKYSPEFADELWSIRERILNMPTEYFEAKPQRAVGFNEIALAVLPKGMTTLRKQLIDAGVQKVVYYDRNIDGDRLKKINSVPDVNFSLKRDTDLSTKDTKALLDIIEHLKGEFEVTKFAKADSKKLAKLTKDILKEYSSQADYDTTFKAIDDLYQYLANGEDGHPAVWDDVYNRAYDIAENIVEKALVLDDELYSQYSDLRQYLRNTPMKFDSRYDSVPSNYENFQDFRRHNWGRLNFTKDGTAIDKVYQELSDLYPEFFDSSEQMNAADQLERIIDVLDEIQPTEINPYSREVSQVASYLANDIIDRFFDVPQAKATFADKAERRVAEARIAGGKKVEAVRQQKDEKIKKLIESQKAKTKRQIDKLRQQRDAKVKKEQEKRREAISRMSESQKAKVLRAQITRHASDLGRKLVSPTDNQHIPEDLRGVVATLLESINLESNYSYDTESHSYKKNDEGLPSKRTKAFEDLRKLYSQIASSVVVDPDLVDEEGLLSDVISLADKRIADMNSTELETVWNTLRAIEASVNTANKVFSQGKFETILGFTEALIEDNTGKKEKTEYKGALGKGKTLATLNMLTPETYFHYLGSAGDSIFRMMRDAQDKHISIMKEVADFTRKTLKGVNVNSLEKTMHTVKLGGEDVILSTAQLMELYVLMKQKQGAEHILVGGILPDATENKWNPRLNTKAEPIRSLSMAEITEALSNLTDEQKNIADELQKFVSTVLAEYGNEASMKVYNYQKFLEKNYWTIRTNKQDRESDISKDTAVITVANKGMAKGRKPDPKTSVHIGSIFDTFATHSSDMATYAAWLGTTEDVNRIRNFKVWEGGEIKKSIKGVLDTVHGKQGAEYLQKLLTDVSIGVKGTDNMNPFDKLIGSYKAASVGANLRVIIQQPTAILRALDMIDAHHLAAGAINPLKGWEKAKKYAPIAQWKDWGHFDINTGRQMKDVLYDNASLLEKTKQVGMWGASMADSLAWGQLWNAVEAETKAKHKELEVGSEEYYETVAKRFTEVVDHTQVVDGIMQRSQIMRSSDALTKMATSFMGEPTKQYNMAISAAYDAVNGKGDARKKAVAKLGRTAMSLVVAGIVNACAQSIIDAMRDDDKEKDYWEKWLGAFIGNEDDKMVQKFGNLGDTFNPLSYVPFVKDVVSVFSGYDVKRMDMEAITKTSNAVANMYKAVTGTGKYTIAEASAQLFVEAARLWGLPVANVKRDVKSLVTSVAIQTDNYLLQYRMEKAMLDINYAGNSKNFMDILFNAYNNDKKAYEFIYNDLIKSGYKVESIKDGMNNRLMKAEGVKNVSDLSKRYMTPSTEKKYDSSLKKIKSSDAWKSANATQRKNAEADVYDFLTSDSKTMQKTREDARAFGVDETEYALWQLATEMVDQPKGQKGNGSYNAKEKAEAIKMLDFDNSELAYFYNTEISKKAYAGGVDIENFAKFKAAVSGLKGDNKKAYVDYYADKYADNAKEYLFFMGSEYSSYKKRSDYIKYFGK